MFIESDSSSFPLLLWFLTKRVVIKKLKVIQNEFIVTSFNPTSFRRV